MSNFSTPKPALRAAILNSLRHLRPGTTICPGRLARNLRLTQAALRPHLLQLEREGYLRVTQKGQPALLRHLRGPYRISLHSALPSSTQTS